jgi:uncharacterized protein YceK
MNLAKEIKMMVRLFCVAVLMAMSGCVSHGTHQAGRTDESAVTSSGYMCPMHHDMTSSTPGKCSKCGMMMEAKAPTTQPDHSSHAGH